MEGALRLAATLSLGALMAIVALTPVYLLLLALASRLARRRGSAAPPGSIERPACAVLIPARNEEARIGAALDSVLGQLRAGDQLLVIAHACTDHTAELALAKGVTVEWLEDGGTGAKSDALLAGLAALPAGEPRVVVVLDADCVLSDGGLDALVSSVAACGAPAQAAYVFEGDQADPLARVSAISLWMKNVVRPRGLSRLGLGVLLTGSGSAYPRELLSSAPLGAGSIAEDTQLSVDLARRGVPVTFVPEAVVRTELPRVKANAERQRRRWEHGHLELLFHDALPLAGSALWRRDRARLGVALEVATPQLSLWLLAWLVVSSIAVMAVMLGLAGEWLLVPLVLLALLAGAIVLGTLECVGLRGGVRVARALPSYIAWRVPRLFDFLRDREHSWLGTPREGEPAPQGFTENAREDRRVLH